MTDMKKHHIYLLAAIVMAALSSCGTAYYGSYEYSFVGVTDNRLADTLSAIDGEYEDSLITASWGFVGNLMFIDLYNKTDEDIVIDWRKVSLIFEGSMTRAAYDFETFIPPHTFLKQQIRWTRFTPVILYSLNPYNYYGYHTYKIIEIRPTYELEVRNSWTRLLGTQFSVYMPMTINGEEKSYRFIMETTKLKVVQERPDDYYEVTEGTDFPQDNKRK